MLIKRTNYLFLSVTLLYLASQFIFRFCFEYEQLMQNIYLLIAFNQLFIILLPVLIFTYRENLKPADFFKIKGISVPEAMLIVLMALSSSFIASALNSIVIYFMEKIGPVELNTVPAAKSPREFWLQVFVIAFLPAVCEEFFFRGVILNSYQSLGVKNSIFVSSFYFALIHFDPCNFLGPFFLGILIAWYCYRTGSIIAGSIAHFTNNFLSVYINYKSNYSPDIESAITTEALLSLIVFAAFAGAFLFIIIKSFEAVTNKKAESLKAPEQTASLAVMLHWPMLIFYGLYLLLALIQIIL